MGHQYNLGCWRDNPFYWSIRRWSRLLTNVNEILLKNNLNHLGNQPELYIYGNDSYLNIEIYKGLALFLNIRVSPVVIGEGG